MLIARLTSEPTPNYPMPSLKKGLNRSVAEIVEIGFGKQVSVRRWIFDRGEDLVTATAITPREWEYTSTVCPGTCDKKARDKITGKDMISRLS